VVLPQRTPSWNRREQEASSYRPKRIRLLLLAESPTSEERSFYSKDGAPDDLFREIVQVLFETAPEGDREPFLKELRRRGVFLVELKPDAPRTGEDLKPYVAPLLINLGTLGPESIIVVDPEVYEVAFAELKGAGLPVVDVKVPRPDGEHPEAFRQKLRQALVRGGLEKMIRPLPAKKRRRGSEHGIGNGSS
jgi:hypothetical protein